MSTSEMVVGFVGIVLLILGITGVRFRNNRWIISLIGETGYRIVISVAGIILIVLAVFTDVLYET